MVSVGKERASPVVVREVRCSRRECICSRASEVLVDTTVNSLRGEELKEVCCDEYDEYKE